MKKILLSVRTFCMASTLMLSVSAFAQGVGVGTTTPNASSILDVTSTNKGFLAPRIALTSSTDQTTIASPATGLLVFNTGASTLSYIGYVFWNGSEWRTFNNNSTANGTISGITCGSAALTPSSYTAGQAFSGSLTVPYTGGNGGAYSAQTITSTGVTGLTATLVAGNFAVGAGSLTYSVTGTPSASSPNTATFAINIGGQTCNAVVGSSLQLSVGQTVGYSIQVPGYFMNNYLSNSSNAQASSSGGASKTRMSNNNNSLENTPSTNTFTNVTLGEFLASQGKNPNAVLPIINGLRLDIKQNNSGSVSPLFYNTTGSNVVASWASISTTNALWKSVFTQVNAGAYSYYVDGDDIFSVDNGSDEFDFTNVTFPSSGQWYQITWHGYRSLSAVDATSTVYIYLSVLRVN